MDNRPAAKKTSTFAFFIVTLVVLALLVLLPFALSSIAGDVLDQSAPVYEIAGASPSESVRADIHLQVTAINEWDGTASLRAALHQNCGDHCPWGDRITFTSVYGDTDSAAEQRPASVVISLPANVRDATQEFKLPIFGDPIRYPFDQYRLTLGVIVQRILPDGSVQTLNPDDARRYATISIQGRLPRTKMSRPLALNPAQVADDGEVEPFLVVEQLGFRRPLYIQVLTILLVVLVTAAAAYAVFLRPLNELIIGSGALVLGVWGVRGILLGTSFPGVTAVDLSLSVVIMFLLATITVRTAWLLEESSAVKPLRSRFFPARPSSQAQPPPEYVPGSSNDAAAPPADSDVAPASNGHSAVQSRVGT